MLCKIMRLIVGSEFWDIYTKEGVKAGLTEAAQLAAAVKGWKFRKRIFN